MAPKKRCLASRSASLVIARRKQRPPLLEVTNLLNISTESGDGACDSNRKRQSDGQPDASFEEEEEEGEDDGTSLASLASTTSTLSAVNISPSSCVC
mmetsp:Transcript_77457/g.155212  ORF Transcript_77457/g.155212 Transcript_77457/m.155212 type:complete len:97 (-) Transcript_77457:253-543(-)